MNIHQLNANIEQKLALLDQKIGKFQEQLKDANSDREQINSSISVLIQLKIKLIKSRDIAERAYHLQRGNDNRRTRQIRLLGLGLCIFSGLGLLALATIVIMR